MAWKLACLSLVAIGCTTGDGLVLPCDARPPGPVDFFFEWTTACPPQGMIASESGGSFTYSVQPNYLATLFADGDMHVEGTFAQANVGGSYYLFSMETPGGLWGLNFHDGYVVDAYMNGDGPSVHGWSRNVGGQNRIGMEFRYELWNLPSSSVSGMNLWSNGFMADTTQVRQLSSRPLSSASSFWEGSKLGNAPLLPLTNVLLRRSSKDPDQVEGVMLGDSLISLYGVTDFPVGSYIYTLEEARTRDGIIGYAYPGETTLQQMSKWNQSPQKGKSYVKWVSIQVGVNDTKTDDAATITANIQALVANINAANPSAKVLLAQITPCRSGVGESTWPAVQVVNANLAGTGENPITGDNLIRLGAWTPLDDGTGSLLAAYDNGDGVHENNAARQLIAGVYRAALLANGLL